MVRHPTISKLTVIYYSIWSGYLSSLLLRWVFCRIFLLILHSGDQSLSPPTEGFELRFMAVLRGTWNWTCETSDQHSKPFSIGGVGVVIDTSKEIQKMETEEEYYDWVAELAHNPVSNFTSENFNILGDFVQLEEHLGYSDFSPLAEFYGTMSEIIPAPADGPKGPDGSDPIIWGRFNATEGSRGVKQIYRVKSAGGKAPATCDGLEDHLEIDFAAAAWIYN